MATQQGDKKLRAAVLILMTLLPLLAASPEPTSDREESAESSEWSAELSDAVEANAEGEAPHVQVEATKRLWIAELSEKANHAEEVADLIDEIRSRTSSSGLTSLKAACKAMCPKCICGVILLPSLPSFRAAKAGIAKPETLRTPKKPKIPIGATTKAATKPVTRQPVPVTLRVTPKPTTAKQGMTPQPTHSMGSGSAKKTKKWLRNHGTNVESQLPDFLLDEESNGNAYKREIDDHDPLSASGSSEIGIE